MSNIYRLGTNFEHLADVLQPYENDIDLIEERIKVRGKTLARANEEQAGWLVYYDQRRAEIKALSKYVELRETAIRGRLFRQYTENSSRELSDRAKEKYIDHDIEYLTIHEILIEVDEILDKLTAIVDAIRNRGFALRNMTNLVVSELTDYTIA